MDNITISDRFAEMWRTSRKDAGKSQEYMAKALGVSKKTVQNWEAGYSSPSQLVGFKWFEVLGLQPLPYYLKLLYSDFAELSPKADRDSIEKALIELVKGMSEDLQRKSLFILNGDHGSSVKGILELFTAYLHIPLEYRLSVAQAIIIDYNVTSAYGVTSEHVKPNIKLLEKSLSCAIKSVASRKKSYSLAEALDND